MVEYLKKPPDVQTLRQLVEQLGVDQLIRAKEYRALGLDGSRDPDVLVERMAAHPQIMQRPIVVVGDRARVGRPPEAVLELL